MSAKTQFVAKVVCSSMAVAGVAMSAMGYGYIPVDPPIQAVFTSVVTDKMAVDVDPITFFRILVRTCKAVFLVLQVWLR